MGTRGPTYGGCSFALWCVPWEAMTSIFSRVVEAVRSRPRTADFVLMAVFVAISVAVLWTSVTEEGGRALDVWGWILGVGAAIPIAFRRTHPPQAAIVSTLCTLTYWVADYPEAAVGPALLILTYSAAAHTATSERARKVGLFIGFALAAVLIAGVVFPEEDLSGLDAVANGVVFSTAWVLGDNMRSRRDRIAEMQRQAVEDEKNRQLEATRAIERERAAIARELHDVVAHGLSVIVVQAAAARRVLHKSPEKADEALLAVEETGRTSLDEMRRLLGVLRSEDNGGERAPQPGLSDLEHLVEQVNGAGLQVEVNVHGEARNLPPGIELSAYRIVQESLTNAIKHAGPARARVDLSFEPSHLEVAVTDDGRGGAAGLADQQDGGGHGLLGMRERIESIGGTFLAGPKSGGGYQVTARIPVA